MNWLMRLKARTRVSVWRVQSEAKKKVPTS
jgi:hypothetical protein